MSQKKNNKKDKPKDKKNRIVDVEKLKADGIIKGEPKDDIERIDGDHIHGGRMDDETTVDTHWPTTQGK
ncbi:hypothetical protein SAMN05421788_1188 [Filimonas lacunae]|uniref:Uncharacterized protein n=1 Tax=Filimonas lacunae TaxID=477680 RepID=A0A173MBD8_9BACT|nr:hypothetical protein [Filimonas lacunae]BAV04874.1 hypothetical protein FLA_0874 [Filimonas lacunae]SIT34630.1 hypothetical protein SAMN05421788_1188 [Filimonas lacunae]